MRSYQVEVNFFFCRLISNFDSYYAFKLFSHIILCNKWANSVQKEIRSYDICTQTKTRWMQNQMLRPLSQKSIISSVKVMLGLNNTDTVENEILDQIPDWKRDSFMAYQRAISFMYYRKRELNSCSREYNWIKIDEAWLEAGRRSNN